jgi:hypothetical protein
MLSMNSMSSIRRDFVASNLRSQLSRLHEILSVIEQEDASCSDYAYESLKEIENSLRQIRKLCCTDN